MPAGTNGKIAQPASFVSSEKVVEPASVTFTSPSAAWSRSTTLTISRPCPEAKPLAAGGVTSPTMSTLPRVSGEVTVEVIFRLVCVLAVAEQPVVTAPGSVA